jgi:hypothetical protein
MAQEIAVATPVVVNALEYNEQETQPSRLQRRKFGAYLPPQQGGPITITQASNNQATVTFMVGAQYFLDTKQSFFIVDAQLQGTTPTVEPITPDNTNWAYLNPLTDSRLTQITITTGNGLQLEKITNADVLASIMRRNMSYNYTSSIAKEALNLFDPNNDLNDLIEITERSRQMRRYIIELRQSDLMSDCYNYLPLRLMALGNSASLRVELIFGSFNQIVTAYSGTPGVGKQGNAYATNPQNLKVVFQNLNYVQSLVQDDLKEQQLMEIVKSNPIVISYDTHNHFQTALPSGPLTQTINVTEYQESVLSVHSVFREQTATQSYNYDNTMFINPNISQTQTQIQPDYYPLQAIPNLNISAGVPNNSELYYQYVLTSEKEKCYQKGLSQSKIKKADSLLIPLQTPIVNNTTSLNSLGSLTSDTDDFILATNFQVFPTDAVGPSEYIQYSAGLNLKVNPNPISINLIMNATNAVFMDTYTTFVRSVVIQTNNIFIVS